MSKFCLTGVSGVGKSSVLEALKKRGFEALDVDSLEGFCHWENNDSGKRVDYYPGIGKDWLDNNEYYCDLEKLKNLIEKSEKPVVVGGIVSNQNEFFDLFDKVFLLYCDKEVFLHRLDTRQNHDFAKDKSEQEHVLGYYQAFEAEMLERGAIPIDTSVLLEEVVGSIISEIQKK